eukprot:TRINITY_DN11340_c0_g1_i2.p1 TRINITY_DN11340_c0_g1~~TRINITY_DN11340_c0_g1_i2.p1  ORF type:complete len:317 (-),score=39.23 TRINITY_DN11340_c0_g1_i2:251-1201(-)
MCIRDRAYANPKSWGAVSTAQADLQLARFQLDQEWLFRIQDPNRSHGRVLLIEADKSAETCSEALSSPGSQKRDDLSVQEASQCFDMIEQLARAQQVLGPDDLVARVLLTDGENVIRTGGGGVCSERQRADQQNECDVFLDTRTPLVGAILSWAERAWAKRADPNVVGPQKQIVVDTSDSFWFANAKKVLEMHGWHVLDRPQPSRSGQHIPRLLYFSSSMDTVNEFRSLVSAGLVDPESCCALLDSYQGVRALEGLTERGLTIRQPLSYICPALLYQELLQQVRAAIMRGEEFESIQNRLDQEANRIRTLATHSNT